MSRVLGLTGTPDVPLTTEELDSFPSPIVNRDPGDETDFRNRPPRAPSLTQALTEVVDTQTETLRANVDELYARTDRMVLGLTNLALSIAALRNKPSTWGRIKLWFQEQVYRGPASSPGSPATRQDTR